MPVPRLRDDARLWELRLLTELERGSPYVDSHKLDQRTKQMVAFLIYEGYLNGVGSCQ